ncbi:hypothetical protein M011DRAFT_479939 [Sporormia fimetaria CBS 119925]|uniref:Uncharacterized protein n=1 Tax=Sporormia fimetaria CBS 119925 TaxID=1340428 RepID=A0A6A6V1E5_9PLEO|nr:hypothetical protein M011DRAFT_479939 [Sporormia fimetaria CBS 119925]
MSDDMFEDYANSNSHAQQELNSLQEQLGEKAKANSDLRLERDGLCLEIEDLRVTLDRKDKESHNLQSDLQKAKEQVQEEVQSRGGLQQDLQQQKERNHVLEEQILELNQKQKDEHSFHSNEAHLKQKIVDYEELLAQQQVSHRTALDEAYRSHEATKEMHKGAVEKNQQLTAENNRVVQELAQQQQCSSRLEERITQLTQDVEKRKKELDAQGERFKQFEIQRGPGVCNGPFELGPAQILLGETTKHFMTWNSERRGIHAQMIAADKDPPSLGKLQVCIVGLQQSYQGAYYSLSREQVELLDTEIQKRKLLGCVMKKNEEGTTSAKRVSNVKDIDEQKGCYYLGEAEVMSQFANDLQWNANRKRNCDWIEERSSNVETRKRKK